MTHKLMESVLPTILAIATSLFAVASVGRADIFQWEYVNPADPSQGKRQSATLAPDGASVDAVPGAVLGPRDLTMAYLLEADLSDADLTFANLTDALLDRATLVGADFSHAEVRGASFDHDPFYRGSGITLAQLYSTASYAANDLSGIGLGGSNLSGANFSGFNLTGANLYLADLTGADFTGAAVRGASFRNAINLAQLYSTASYAARDLGAIDLSFNDLPNSDFAGHNLAGASFNITNLAGADLSRANLSGARFGTFCYPCDGANLSGADLSHANLTNAGLGDAYLDGADLTGAIVRGAGLNAFTSAQLYSTASYQAGDLSGVYFENRNLSGWNFAGQNLTNSYFSWMLLADADFTGADLRGAGFVLADLSRSTSDNLIGTDGRINGLELQAGQLLTVRDYDGDEAQWWRDAVLPTPITIDEHLAIDAGGTLRMVFEADDWDSTISFASGIPVTLGGTLELTFANGVDLPRQVGRTFDLFDWSGVAPSGTFQIDTPYCWDLSNLYITGEITLIPEPSAFCLIAMAFLGVTQNLARRHRCN